MMAIARSMNVGHNIVGVAQGCWMPAMILFLVRKYLAREKERVPTM